MSRMVISRIYTHSQAIGIFIILLACINYMNSLDGEVWSTGRQRFAMKKTLGSGKRSLILSFLSESVFLSLVSLVLAIGIVFAVIRSYKRSIS
jgi:putative ABC transport system permease protein